MFSTLRVVASYHVAKPVPRSSFLGAAEDMAHSSLRFGMGRFTTEAEVDFVVEKIVAVVQRLRDMRYAIYPPFPSHHHLSSLTRVSFRTVHCGRWSRKESISIPLTGRSTEPRGTITITLLTTLQLASYICEPPQPRGRPLLYDVYAFFYVRKIWITFGLYVIDAIGTVDCNARPV